MKATDRQVVLDLLQAGEAYLLLLIATSFLIKDTQMSEPETAMQRSRDKSREQLVDAIEAVVRRAEENG
jgi:hypothetical protein